MNNAAHPRPWRHWRGLGVWNYYFLLKFTLLWLGYLNFHLLDNLVFTAFLLFPLPSPRLHRWRQILGIPLGFMVFYNDTWLPGVHSILAARSQVSGFSAAYLLELLNRFIDWQWVGAAFVLLVAYLFIAQWLRVTVFTLAVLLGLTIVNLGGPRFQWRMLSPTPVAARPADTPDDMAQPSTSAPPTSGNLTAWLDAFYQRESRRVTAFPQTLPADAQPFDLLIIQICSLSWSDLQAVNLQNAPFWNTFDIVFDDFNSATAYSGPASIRLLRASCGQESHKNLYSPANRQCYLFDNLAKLGFKPQLMLDHSGQFDNFLKDLRDDADLQAPLMSQAGIRHPLVAFDGEPIYDDLQLLQRWLAQRVDNGDTRSATFFNLITLHDGNRYPGAHAAAGYAVRASTLFRQLDEFFRQLQQSGRRVAVVVVPEHGAALVGDKLQMPGLRDIPSPSITHVPVGIKLIGIEAPHARPPLHITGPTSYLALSELVARLADGKLFAAPQIDWTALTRDLPHTAAVSENAGAIVMEYQGHPYIQLDGGDWVPYPQ
ncbi:cellulose biosynthesis protein BcsG [Martelella alba]|uniref:Cellulose biosynthesis protein BcsG n=1 Tax=Martelella alba TaxID=2590451 RepID=A0ABY2SPE6_9HYPH|nr:cellulose biosynthesis protein BcsG [Martelella alba]TKI07809.1 cellulose biosynthesis protein BcsG [Martelella alba]